ncbi:MAG TPA: hypothetical protein VEG37_04445 [Burkholderiales bacterium]|nr:hypothetical protein [Burkholderiales bacterium]
MKHRDRLVSGTTGEFDAKVGYFNWTFESGGNLALIEGMINSIRT